MCVSGDEMKQTSQGSTFEEGVLKYEAGDVLISLQKKSLIELLDVEIWYVIADLNMKQYYGLKLSCTKNTILEKKKLSLLNKLDLLKNIQSEVMDTEKILHHLKIISVILTAKPICVSCGMSVECEEIVLWRWYYTYWIW